MANEEQLSILKQGVEIWNEWRQKQDYSFSALSIPYHHRAGIQVYFLDVRIA